MGKKPKVRTVTKIKEIIINPKDIPFSLCSLIPKSSLTLSEVIEAKEQYVDELKFLYSTSFHLFKELLTRTISGLNNKNFSLPSLILRNKSLPDLLNEVQEYDTSEEVKHIFYAHLDNFINTLLSEIKSFENTNPGLIFRSISDALKIVSHSSKEAYYLTRSIFSEDSQSGLTCESMSQFLFYEKLIKDKMFRNFIQKVKNSEKITENRNADTDYKINGDTIFQL